MANALASFLPDQRLPTNATAPVPGPASKPAIVTSPNGLASPFAPARKPQNDLLEATLDGFQRGLDPKGFEARREREKSGALEKAKQTLALMQQQRDLPTEQRAQWWTQNAPQIGQIIGQDLTQQQVDPNAFTDQALDGQIAMLSGQLGIAPTQPEPMSEYEAAQIRLKEREAGQPRHQFLQGQDGSIAVGNLTDGTIQELRPGQPKPDPANYDMVTTADGVIAVNKRNPNERIRIGAPPPRSTAGDGVGFQSLTPEQVAQRGYPAGTVVQVDSRGREYVNSRPSTQQTGQPTESERSAGLHATVSINGLRNLMAQEAGGYNRAGVQEQAAGFVGGENERLYDQAADEFIDGYLRAMTGAAATKTEIDTYRKQWFPTWGDTAPVIRQKAVGRLNALKGMKSKAGRAWHPEWDTMIASLEQQLAAPQAAEGPKFPDGTPITAETLQQLPPNLRAIYSRMLPQEDDDTALNAHIDSLFPADDGVDQGPIVGQVEDGFRFVGGDPGDPNNWEPVQ